MFSLNNQIHDKDNGCSLEKQNFISLAKNYCKTYIIQGWYGFAVPIPAESTNQGIVLVRSMLAISKKIIKQENNQIELNLQSFFTLLYFCTWHQVNVFFQCNMRVFHPNANFLNKRLYTHIHTYFALLKLTYLRSYLHAFIYSYIHTYIHTYIPTYIHTYIYIYTYIHIYIHTYIHTYMHAIPMYWTLSQEVYILTI